MQPPSSAMRSATIHFKTHAVGLSQASTIPRRTHLLNPYPLSLRSVHQSSTPPTSSKATEPAIPETTTPLLSPHISPQRSSTRLQAYAPHLTAISHRTGVPFASLAGAFLVLHEITAIVPVIIFYFIFQALGAGAGLVAWISGLKEESVPEDEIYGEPAGQRVKQGGWKGWVGGWMVEAEEKAERVGRRYGVLGYEKEIRGRKGEARAGVPTAGSGGDAQVTAGGATEKVANAIAAYVVVKALLPLRIGLSLALAPSFARFALYPIRRLMGRIKPKSKPLPKAPHSGDAS